MNISAAEIAQWKRWSMSKYDCSKCLDYVHEERRMCIGRDCEGCVLNGSSGLCYVPDSIEKIDIVQKWSDKYPEPHEKTILEDFKEKYPDYAHKYDSDIPLACADDLYKTQYDGCNTAESDACRKCWDRPLSEVQNENQKYY